MTFNAAVNLCLKNSLLPINPAFQVSQVTKSLWLNRSLTPASYQLIYTDLLAKSKEQSGEIVWQDIFASGPNSVLYPKHPILVSLAALPFFALFGDAGFWILNQIFLFAIFFAIFRITCELYSHKVAFFTLAISFGGTQIFLDSWGFSYDLASAALILFGFERAEKRPLLGSFLISLSLFIRISNIVFLALPFAWKLLHPDLEWSHKAALKGLVFGFIPLCLVNWYMWGSPFKTPYHNLIYFYDGNALIETSGHVLTIKVFLADWGEKLFSKTNGVLLYNPALFAAFFGLAFTPKPYRSFTIVLSTCAIINILLIFAYSHWDASTLGNRFLLPSIRLLTMTIAAISQKFSQKQN